MTLSYDQKLFICSVPAFCKLTWLVLGEVQECRCHKAEQFIALTSRVLSEYSTLFSPPSEREREKDLFLSLPLFLSFSVNN